MGWMKALYRLLDSLRNGVRKIMRQLAKGLNRLTAGKLSPNVITVVGLLAHLPIAYLITQNQFYWAAGLLVVFGLFDTLDGELARLQGKASSAGMVLDATTDRFKEVFLYTGIVYWLAGSTHPRQAVWAVVACGASLCVSYVKAKGETAIKDQKLTANEINRLFQDGLLRFEVRMALLVIGLVAHQLVVAVASIAILASLTAVDRLVKIQRYLK
jgi:phosphatidylglycerophosphate synthase